MRRTLAARLKRLRMGAGITMVQLARATGISQGKISKIETGVQSARVDHVAAWVTACGADERTQAQLLELAEAAQSEASSWRQEHRAGLAAKQARVGQWERRATRIRDFQSALVPGLLQTRAYAAAVFGFADASEQRDREAAVTARLARQRILEQSEPAVEVIVTEAAVAWPCTGGPADVRTEQRQQLLDAVAARRIRLGVLPSTAPGPPRLNGFTIYDFADTHEQLVVVEMFAAELYHEDQRDVATYEQIFAELATGALFGADAAALIRVI